jgi:hypothetical protein
MWPIIYGWIKGNSFQEVTGFHLCWVNHCFCSDLPPVCTRGCQYNALTLAAIFCVVRKLFKSVETGGRDTVTQTLTHLHFHGCPSWAVWYKHGRLAVEIKEQHFDTSCVYFV